MIAVKNILSEVPEPQNTEKQTTGKTEQKHAFSQVLEKTQQKEADNFLDDGASEKQLPEEAGDVSDVTAEAIDQAVVPMFLLPFLEPVTEMVEPKQPSVEMVLGELTGIPNDGKMLEIAGNIVEQVEKNIVDQLAKGQVETEGPLIIEPEIKPLVQEQPKLNMAPVNPVVGQTDLSEMTETQLKKDILPVNLVVEQTDLPEMAEAQPKQNVLPVNPIVGKTDLSEMTEAQPKKDILPVNPVVGNIDLPEMAETQPEKDVLPVNPVVGKTDLSAESKVILSVAPEMTKELTGKQKMPLVQQPLEKKVSQEPQTTTKETFWQQISSKLAVKKVIQPLTAQNANNEQGTTTGFAQPLPTEAKGTNPTTINVETWQPVETEVQEDVVDQVIKQVQIDLKEGQTEMRMHLKPANLGDLQMKVVVEGGKVSAQFLTTTNAAKEALEVNLQQLKQNLQEQGIKVEKISILLSSGDLQFNQQQQDQSLYQTQKNGKQWRKSGSDYEALEAIESQTMPVKAQILSAEQVDYRA